MALKNSFFSKLFHGGSEKREKQPSEEKAVHPEAKTEPPPGPPAVPDIPAAPAEPLPPAEPLLSDVAVLELPTEHAIHRLWDLRVAQAGWCPSPHLRLMAPSGQPEPLTPAVAEREIPRLRLVVTTSANQRIVQAIPRDLDAPLPTMDAQPVVFLTQDQLTAWLLVYPPVGEGKELDRDMLRQALENAKVTYGLDQRLLDALPDDQNRYFQLFLVARGVPAVHGKDGGIVDMFSRQIRREIVVDEFDQVDYASLNLVQNIEQGDTICRIIPSLAGTPGTNVLGAPIAARDGKPAQPPKGLNTELSEDGSKLISLASGHVEFYNRAFHVKLVLEVPGNVDYSTGNIDFIGDVHIKGDVTNGFIVRAAGNVVVDGMVETASVEAGGDVIVAKGAVGNGHTVISAQRGVFAKYLENCRVRAREALQADCIINCNVYCNGTVQARSGRGTILGGTIRASYEVSASVVGSRGERATAIYLGGIPCETFERDGLLDEIYALKEQYARTEHQPDSPAKISRMSSLRMKISAAQTKLDQSDQDMARIDETAALEEHDNRRLRGGIVYPGVTLTIGDVTLPVHYETRQCVFALVDGEIALM